MRRFVLAAVLVLATGAASSQTPAREAAVGVAAGQVPDASDILFDQASMKNTPPGATLTYAYARRSGIAKGPFGPPLDDTIKFTLEPGKDADTRTIRVQMFSGANRVPAGPFEDYPGNPILVLFLENHLKGIAPLLGANPRYLKNAIRKGLREKATVSPTQVTFQGKSIDGWRIVTKPFEGDPQTDRMRGFENLTYTFVTAPGVPGEIVSIEAQATKPDGGELLEERVTYDQDAG